MGIQSGPDSNSIDLELSFGTFGLELYDASIPNCKTLRLLPQAYFSGGNDDHRATELISVLAANASIPYVLILLLTVGPAPSAFKVGVPSTAAVLFHLSLPLSCCSCF